MTGDAGPADELTLDRRAFIARMAAAGFVAPAVVTLLDPAVAVAVGRGSQDPTTTGAPPTTPAPSTTVGPTTTGPPITTPAPTTTGAPMTTPVPTTTERPHHHHHHHHHHDHDHRGRF
ncbi:MAG: hypothetical protein ACLP0J_13850 [Solirubrobacteraceae bacterium]